MTLILVHPNCLCPKSNSGIVAAFLYCGGYLLPSIPLAYHSISIPDDLFGPLHVLRREFEGDAGIVFRRISMLGRVQLVIGGRGSTTNSASLRRTMEVEIERMGRARYVSRGNWRDEDSRPRRKRKAMMAVDALVRIRRRSQKVVYASLRKGWEIGH